jgi:hypothetical protein
MVSISREVIRPVLKSLYLYKKCLLTPLPILADQS